MPESFPFRSESGDLFPLISLVEEHLMHQRYEDVNDFADRTDAA